MGSIDTSEIQQELHYYPNGLPHFGEYYGNEDAFDYKYNSKQFYSDLELGYYRLGNRWLDPACGRIMSTDRFSEKYAFQSPFVLSAGNPVKFIDVNGDSIKINGVTYLPGENYERNNDFVSSIVNLLNDINNTKASSPVLELLSESENNFDFVNEAPNNKEAGAAFYPAGEGGGILKVGKSNSLRDVSHELFHGFQYETGLTELGTTAAEIGAFLFEDVVSLQSLTGGVLTISDNKYGENFDKAYEALLLGGFNQRDYITANVFFKYSARNAGGLYTKVKQSTPAYPAISRFIPF